MVLVMMQFVMSLFGTFSSIKCCKHCVWIPGKWPQVREWHAKRLKSYWVCFICRKISPDNATWAGLTHFLLAGVSGPVLDVKTVSYLMYFCMILIANRDYFMHMNMKFVPVPSDNSDRSVTCPKFNFLAFSPVPDGWTKLKVEPWGKILLEIVPPISYKAWVL